MLHDNRCFRRLIILFPEFNQLNKVTHLLPDNEENTVSKTISLFVQVFVILNEWMIRWKSNHLRPSPIHPDLVKNVLFYHKRTFLISMRSNTRHFSLSYPDARSEFVIGTWQKRKISDLMFILRDRHDVKMFREQKLYTGFCSETFIYNVVFALF